MLYASMFCGWLVFLWGLFNQMFWIMVLGMVLIYIPILISDIRHDKLKKRLEMFGFYHSVENEHKRDRGHRWKR